MLTTLSNGRPGIRTPLQVEIRSPHFPRKDELPRVPNQQEKLPRVPDRTDELSQHLGLAGARPSKEKGEQASAPATDSLPILDFIASDESLDRFGEIICAAGWRLDTYRRNPVFQNAHQYGDILFTLGKALITEVRGGKAGSSHPGGPNPPAAPYLFQRVQFATEVNPAARIAYGLYQGKFLHAVSVGFIPLRWEDVPAGGAGAAGLGGDASRETPASGAAVRGSGAASRRQARRRYLEQELLEVSAVGIPANPNALALGLRAGAIEKSDLREVLALLRSLLAWPRDPLLRRSSAVRGFPGPLSREELLSFARELHGILRRA